MKIGIVGCGNLGLSILNGIKNETPDAQVYASKRNIDSIKSLSSETVKITTDNSELIENSEIIILALKPYNILPFIKEHKDSFDSSRHTLVSVATGIEISETNSTLISLPGATFNRIPFCSANISTIPADSKE